MYLKFCMICGLDQASFSRWGTHNRKQETKSYDREVMYDVRFNMMQSISFAVLLLIYGMWAKRKVYFYERFVISAPVIGGFAFAFVNLRCNRPACWN